MVICNCSSKTRDQAWHSVTSELLTPEGGIRAWHVRHQSFWHQSVTPDMGTWPGPTGRKPSAHPVAQPSKRSIRPNFLACTSCSERGNIDICVRTTVLCSYGLSITNPRLRHVEIMFSATLLVPTTPEVSRSESLNSYRVFHPRGPNLGGIRTTYKQGCRR